MHHKQADVEQATVARRVFELEQVSDDQEDWEAMAAALDFSARRERIQDEWQAVGVAQSIELGRFSPAALQRLWDALASRRRWEQAANGQRDPAQVDAVDAREEAVCADLYATHLAWLRRQVSSHR